MASTPPWALISKLDQAIELIRERAEGNGWSGDHRPSFTEHDLQAFEHRAGRPLPSDLRRFLAWYDDTLWARAINPESRTITDSKLVIRADGAFVQPGDESDHRDDPIKIHFPDNWAWLTPYGSDHHSCDMGPGDWIHIAVEEYGLDAGWLQTEFVMFASSGFGEWLAYCVNPPAAGPRVVAYVLHEPNVWFSATTLEHWLARTAYLGLEPAFGYGDVEHVPEPERSWVRRELKELNPLIDWL